MRKLTRNAILVPLAVPALAACAELDLEHTQTGYDEARECFEVLMAASGNDRSAGIEQRYYGSTKAMQAMTEIAPVIGMDEQQQREDIHKSSGRINGLIKMAETDSRSAEWVAIEEKAQTCSDKYGNPMLS